MSRLRGADVTELHALVPPIYVRPELIHQMRNRRSRSSVLHLLVIEDNAADVRLMKEALRLWTTPHCIHVADDGEEATLEATILARDELVLKLTVSFCVPASLPVQELTIESTLKTGLPPIFTLRASLSRLPVPAGVMIG